MNVDESFDCIVIGGGPAGLEAITYLARYRRNALLIDAGQSRARLAPRIMNLGGYSKGISGKSLLRRMRRQAEQFGARFLEATAEVRRTRGGFYVTAAGKIWFARFVILATGIVDEQPHGIECHELCRRRLLAYCPVCDGFEHAGRKIGVLVKGRNALNKARFIRDISHDLHILNVSEEAVPAKDARAIQKLGAKLYSGTLRALTAGRAGGVRVSLDGQKPLDLDLVYVELGIRVAAKATKSLPGIRRAEHGRYSISRHLETSVPGLYAIGDCANSLAQISVAIGEAAVAATHIHNRLRQFSIVAQSY